MTHDEPPSREAAEAAGARVISTRCAESEMPIAVGGLADLVETAFAEMPAAGSGALYVSEWSILPANTGGGPTGSVIQITPGS